MTTALADPSSLTSRQRQALCVLYEAGAGAAGEARSMETLRHRLDLVYRLPDSRYGSALSWLEAKALVRSHRRAKGRLSFAYEDLRYWQLTSAGEQLAQSLLGPMAARSRPNFQV
jgi:hypothetical protein